MYKKIPKPKVYATMFEAKGSLDFRTISHKMFREGYKMGPSHVRLLLIDILKKMIKGISEGQTGKKCKIDSEKLQEIATDVDFQNILAPFIKAAYKDNLDSFEEIG